ncbi:MAG: hypothetical protein ACHQ5A_06360 [Opitutales bacterium]
MKPFLFGKKSITGESLRAPHVHPPPAPAGGVRPVPPGVSVETVKQGDKVVRLIVTCSCGERIEIDCLYPVGS